MPTLILTGGEGAGRQFQIQGAMFVGREGADISLSDPQVSARHALIRAADGGVEISDLGSESGTFVNGARIDGVRRLNHGDVVTVGTTSFAVDL